MMKRKKRRNPLTADQLTAKWKTEAGLQHLDLAIFHIVKFVQLMPERTKKCGKKNTKPSKNNTTT